MWYCVKVTTRQQVGLCWVCIVTNSFYALIAQDNDTRNISIKYQSSGNVSTKHIVPIAHLIHVCISSHVFWQWI